MATLRVAVPDDIQAVLEFWQEATAEPSTTDDAAAIDALLSRSPGGLILAIDGDLIVGTIIAVWDGWRGSFYRLAVAPALRRRGIASALVVEGERQLRGAGVRRMHLIAGRADASAAEAFWVSAGYEPTDQLRFVKTFG